MHPICFKLGSFTIYWYGIFIAAGVFFGGLVLQKNACKQGYSQETVTRLIFWTIIWGILGGRILHVIVQFPYYYRHPLEILSIRNGGLAVEGAVIVALIFLTVYSKIKRFNLLGMLDIVSLSVTLGQSIGRLGCFLNGCCYGKPTEFFLGLGVKFPHLAEKVHPTQLYYSTAYIVLFFILKRMYKKHLQPGTVFVTYILAFALIRYIIDMLRGDLFPTGLGLYSTQIIGIVLFITGTVWFLFILGKQTKS